MDPTDHTYHLITSTDETPQTEFMHLRFSEVSQEYHVVPPHSMLHSIVFKEWFLDECDNKEVEVLKRQRDPIKQPNGVDPNRWVTFRRIHNCSGTALI